MNFATIINIPSLFLYERYLLTNKLPKYVEHYMEILDEQNFLIEIKNDFYTQYKKLILFPYTKKSYGTKMNFRTASKQFYLKNNKFVKQYFKKKIIKGIQYV